MSITITQTQDRISQRRRRRQESAPEKYRVRARYRYTEYKWVETSDTGTFRQMWEKYKDTHLFFCADIPPFDEYGQRVKRADAYELDENELDQYGSHKAWIEPGWLVDNKPVILVYNARRAV